MTPPSSFLATYVWDSLSKGYEFDAHSKLSFFVCIIILAYAYKVCPTIPCLLRPD